MISQIDDFGAPQTSSRRPPETPISWISHRKSMWFAIEIETRFAELAVSQVLEIDSIRESWHMDFCQIWWFCWSWSGLTRKSIFGNSILPPRFPLLSTNAGAGSTCKNSQQLSSRFIDQILDLLICLIFGPFFDHFLRSAFHNSIAFPYTSSWV